MSNFLQKNSIKRLLMGCWLLLWAILVYLLLTIIVTRTTRTLLILVVIGLWSGALFLFWKNKYTRATNLILGVTFCLIGILPGHDNNPSALRNEYVNSLTKYEGAPYVYGGESTRGVDCSGFVRCGLMDADFKQGILTANPKLLRESVWLWWNDASVADIVKGYDNKTEYLVSANGLGELDYSVVMPGDLAIMTSYNHVLVCVGKNGWMEADASRVKVIKFVVTEQNKSAYNSPLQIMRWKQFEGSK